MSFIEGRYKTTYLQKNEVEKYDTLVERLPDTQIDTTQNTIYYNRLLTFVKGNGEKIIVSTFYVGKEKSSNLERYRLMFERYLEKMILHK